MIILLNRIILHNFAVFVAKNFWVFISYAVYRNKLTDMFINNINGFLNRNLSLFFCPSDIKLAWKAKQNQRESTFFLFLWFFSQNSGSKEIKNTNFWKRMALKILGSSVDHFSNRPVFGHFSRSENLMILFQRLNFCQMDFRNHID